MGLNVAHRQTGGIKADDLVIDAVDPGLAFLHQLRLEAALPVARHGQRHLAVRSLHPLRRNSVPAVGLFAWRFCASFIAQMRGQFGPEHPLHQPDLQFLHQPGLAEQIVRPLAALQQFVQQFVRNRHRPCSSQETWTRL